MQPEEERRTTLPDANNCRQTAGDSPSPDRWLVQTRKSVGLKLKKAYKDFVDYAKSSEL